MFVSEQCVTTWLGHNCWSSPWKHVKTCYSAYLFRHFPYEAVRECRGEVCRRWNVGLEASVAKDKPSINKLCEDDYHLHLWSFKTHYNYYSFPIITIVSICNCAVWVQVSRGASIGSHGLLLSVNGSSLIPSVSVSFPGHIPAHNAWDEASDKSDNRIDIIVDNYKDSSNKHCRRSSLECASSIGVYTSMHRTGRWTEGEDLLLTLVHLPAEP